MKTITFYILLVILFAVSCKNSISTNENEQIIFHTKSNSYLTTDSIVVLIENNTNSDFEIALRCGLYLEMYYQKKENNAWSNYYWFSWMSLKCLSTTEKIKSYNIFQYLIPSDEITEKGTYRLVLANDTAIVSNLFEVK